MADEADDATNAAELFLSSLLYEHQKKAFKEKLLMPNGECQNPACGLDVAPDQIFCGSKCAVEYMRYQNAK